MSAIVLAAAAAAALCTAPGGKPFPIYQFAANAIPRIDGQRDEWAEVPDSYVIGTDRIAADDGSSRKPDPASLDIKVRIGWVKGLNRLYVLYEAYDDYWDFDRPGLTNDIFELVVDGDRSGGPLIARFHPDVVARREGTAVGGLSDSDAWSTFQNVHAQNYHIFTPAGSKDWAMAWGPQASWIKRLPWSNIAYRHKLKPGDAGKLTMEMWITPFDRADPDDPAKSIETPLTEDKVIGMAWAVIDQDGPKVKGSRFWNLSPQHTMYGQASELCAFRLMPREGASEALVADWSYRVTDRARRTVAFRDDTRGDVTTRLWDFGDGTSSAEAAPVHSYATAGKFIVTLAVSGASGGAKHSKVWDVSFVADPPK